MQLPAWNEALGLPRPWDQQWSLRIQQILAFETDLLEYGDIFDGSTWSRPGRPSWPGRPGPSSRTCWPWAGPSRPSTSSSPAWSPARPSGSARIESGEQKVVGVNCFTETAPSPLAAAGDAGAILQVDPAVEAELVADVARWRAGRDGAAVQRALDELRRAAEGDDQRDAGHHRPGPRRRDDRRVGRRHCGRCSASTGPRPGVGGGVGPPGP